MKCTTLFSLLALILLALCTAIPAVDAQIIYNVNVNTAGLNGTPGGLAFDFITGDAATPNNTVLVTGFATNGALTGSTNTNVGNATGNLPGPLTLRDSGFTESFRGETFGSTLSFTLSPTNSFAAPGAPDEFSFFLTNSANTDTLVTTSDPTGANALFVLDLRGGATPALTVFASRTQGVNYSVTAVPEPTTFAFAITGLVVSGVFLRFRRRRP